MQKGVTEHREYLLLASTQRWKGDTGIFIRGPVQHNARVRAGSRQITARAIDIAKSPMAEDRARARDDR